MQRGKYKSQLHQSKSLKHSVSTNQIKSTKQITTQLTKQIVIKASDFSTYFSIFLANSKGKDKFLSLFQYLLQFICVCTKHSNRQNLSKLYRSKQLMDILIMYNIKENISSARKVFRLLRFLDQIKGLSKILKTNKPLAFKILSTITYFCSIMYYITDNLIWFLGICVKSQAFQKSIVKSWKYRKNFFSLSRISFYLIIVVYSIYLQKVDNNDLQKRIKNSISFDNQFDVSLTNQTKLHMQGRRKLRFLYLQISLSLCRFLMLIKSLKLAFHKDLDPIFIAGCGVAAAVMNFLKALLQKKIILNLDKKIESNNNGVISLSKIENDIQIKLY